MSAVESMALLVLVSNGTRTLFSMDCRMCLVDEAVGGKLAEVGKEGRIRLLLPDFGRKSMES